MRFKKQKEGQKKINKIRLIIIIDKLFQSSYLIFYFVEKSRCSSSNDGKIMTGDIQWNFDYLLFSGGSGTKKHTLSMIYFKHLLTWEVTKD